MLQKSTTSLYNVIFCVHILCIACEYLKDLKSSFEQRICHESNQVLKRRCNIICKLPNEDPSPQRYSFLSVHFRNKGNPIRPAISPNRRLKTEIHL